MKKNKLLLLNKHNKLLYNNKLNKKNRKNQRNNKNNLVKLLIHHKHQQANLLKPKEKYHKINY